MSADLNRRNQRCSSVELTVKNKSHGKRKLCINQTKRFSFAQNVAQSRERFNIKRAAVFFDQAPNCIRRSIRCSFENDQIDFFPRLVKHSKCAVIRSDQLDCPFDNFARNFPKIRMRIERVGNFKQRVRAFCFLLLRHIKPRILIPNRNLLGNGFKESNFFIKPFARRVNIVQPD